MIKSWKEARDAGMTKEALQELCNYDLALEERIKISLKIKHPGASEKQINAWAAGAIRRKMQKEHWGYSPI